MPAYLIVRHQLDDPALFKTYQQAVLPPVVEKYRGRFIVRSGSAVTLEGPLESRNIIVIEFPALSDAQAFYDSPGLAEVRKEHERIGTFEAIVVEGDG